MSLFTVVLDNAGGTYIAQEPANDPQAALSAWRLRIKRDGGGDITEAAGAFELEQKIELVAVAGLTGVWCTTATAPKGLALVNLVRTAET